MSGSGVTMNASASSALHSSAMVHQPWAWIVSARDWTAMSTTSTAMPIGKASARTPDSTGVPVSPASTQAATSRASGAIPWIGSVGGRAPGPQKTR